MIKISRNIGHNERRITIVPWRNGTVVVVDPESMVSSVLGRRKKEHLTWCVKEEHFGEA